MLALTRRIGEEIIIDRGVRVVVLAVHGRRVRLGIEAPPDVRVDRKEIHQRRARRSPVLAGVNGSLEPQP
ncbi:MAG: carbon storage regulator [Planctomycetia bacterium]|nr:carbon storage regulator [Planctomycetia bacterium]